MSGSDGQNVRMGSSEGRRPTRGYTSSDQTAAGLIGVSYGVPRPVKYAIDSNYSIEG